MLLLMRGGVPVCGYECHARSDRAEIKQGDGQRMRSDIKGRNESKPVRLERDQSAL